MQQFVECRLLTGMKSLLLREKGRDGNPAFKPPLSTRSVRAAGRLQAPRTSGGFLRRYSDAKRKKGVNKHTEPVGCCARTTHHFGEDTNHIRDRDMVRCGGESTFV